MSSIVYDILLLKHNRFIYLSVELYKILAQYGSVCTPEKVLATDGKSESKWHESTTECAKVGVYTRLYWKNRY